MSLWNRWGQSWSSDARTPERREDTTPIHPRSPPKGPPAGTLTDGEDATPDAEEDRHRSTQGAHRGRSARPCHSGRRLWGWRVAPSGSGGLGTCSGTTEEAQTSAGPQQGLTGAAGPHRCVAQTCDRAAPGQLPPSGGQGRPPPPPPSLGSEERHGAGAPRRRAHRGVVSFAGGPSPLSLCGLPC